MISNLHACNVLDTIELPWKVSAQLAIRLILNGAPKQVFHVVNEFFKNLGLVELVEIELENTINWTNASDNTLIAKTLVNSDYESGVNKVEGWPIFPTSIRFYVYADLPLSKPFVIGGLRHGGHVDNRDEYVVFDRIRRFQRDLFTFLMNIARGQVDGAVNSNDCSH